MKKILLTLILFGCLAAIVSAAMTYDADNYQKNRQYLLGGEGTSDPVYNFISEVEDILEGTTGFVGGIYIVPQSAAGTAQEGQIYYDSDEDVYYGYANGSWVNLGAGAGSPAGSDTQMQYNNNGSFGAISTIIWDDTNLEFADDQSLAFGSSADWTVNFDDSVDDQLLWLTSATAAGAITDPLYEIIVGASPTDNQQVFGVAKGTQSSNTALFTVDEDGDVAIAGTLDVTGAFSAASFTGDIILSSAETITNTIDSEIKFAEDSGEDLIFDMDSASNAIGLKSSTGVDELAMGTVDDLTGVGTIVMDAAECSVSCTADAATEDFTISQAGGVDASLILSSAGTGADALQISTVAGGMDITVAGAAAGEDLDITSNEQIILTSSEDDDQAIYLHTSNAAGQIAINSADTTADGIEIDSAGGIEIDAADDIDITLVTNGDGEDISLNMTGSHDSSIILDNTQGTGTDAISLQATAGSVDIDAAATGDITLNGGQIILTGELNTAGAIQLACNAGSSETITITNTQGTGAGAIALESTAGGITAKVCDEKSLQIGNSALDAYFVVAASATVGNEDCRVVNTNGTDDKAIEITASSGGFDLSAAKSVVLTSSENQSDAIQITASDAAGGCVINVGSGGISMSDDNVTNIGEISVDDILSDASTDVMWTMKTVVKTIDVDDDASSDDFQFDDDAADQLEQPVDLGAIIPAYAEVVSAQIRCFETVTGSAQMSISLGTSSGNTEILTAANTDTANDINSTGAGDGPEITAANTAKHVWINATPAVNWDTLDAGRWAVMITYIDYGAVYTEKTD